MKAILVTTPKAQSSDAAREAQVCIEAGEGFYFRRFATQPRELDDGTRVYYIEDGYIRGFAVVEYTTNAAGARCATTGRTWPAGFYAVMRADTWKWIEPIPYRGFQGWRYFDDRDVRVVGGWLEAKP